MYEMSLSGGCLCGRVRYETRGAPANVRVCHCRTCQQATGQPFNARALFAGDQITVSGEITRYASSPTLDRAFCPICGTTLFGFRQGTDAVAVMLGSLDDPDAIRPTEHVWTSRKLYWVCIEEGVLEWPQASRV